MEEDSKEINLSTYWLFWRLNFGIHMVIGLLANIAGIVVIFTQGEVINGLALSGAGSFAIINGWQGFAELANNQVDEPYKTKEKSSQ